MDKWLLLLTLVLFALGLVMVFSASNVAAFMRYDTSPYRFVLKQGLFLLVSFILALIMLRINTKVYGFLSWPMMLVILGLLAAVFIYGKTTNQATSWFAIKGFTLQPSEFAKVIVIIWLASFYGINKNRLDKYIPVISPILISLIGTVLIMLQPDLGTAIIYTLIIAFIFFIVPIEKVVKLKIILGTVVLGIIGVVVLIIAGKNPISERQLSRFDFSKPCSEEKFYTDGNQVCNAYIAINNGGLTGKGLGNSTQKYLYLPEAHTDFIFAILLEELGLIAGAAVIIVYMLILARIVTIGRRSHNISNSIMCYAIAFYIFLHIVVNLMGIFGMMPMTGVPLPFLSYGGSFTMCLVVSLAIVQRVSIENKLFQEKRNS